MSKTATATDAIEWVCEVCARPIEADGSVFIRSSERRRATEDRKERRRMEREKKKSSPKINGMHVVMWTGAEIMTLPDYRAPWHAMHDECDPDPDDTVYWIAVGRIDTFTKVVAWSAHLNGKHWFPLTNWYDVMRRHLGNRAFI